MIYPEVLVGRREQYRHTHAIKGGCFYVESYLHHDEHGVVSTIRKEQPISKRTLRSIISRTNWDVSTTMSGTGSKENSYL